MSHIEYLTKHLYPTVVKFARDPVTNYLIHKDDWSKFRNDTLEHGGFIINIPKSEYVFFSLATSWPKSDVCGTKLPNLKAVEPIRYFNSILAVKRSTFNDFYEYDSTPARFIDYIDSVYKSDYMSVYEAFLLSMVNLNLSPVYVLSENKLSSKFTRAVLTSNSKNSFMACVVSDSSTDVGVLLPIHNAAYKLNDAQINKEDKDILFKSLAKLGVAINFANANGDNLEVVAHEMTKGKGFDVLDIISE